MPTNQQKPIVGWDNGRPILYWAKYDLYEELEQNARVLIDLHYCKPTNYPFQIYDAITTVRNRRQYFWRDIPSNWYIGWTA